MDEQDKERKEKHKEWMRRVVVTVKRVIFQIYYGENKQFF
jgi:hypothetical protein